MVDPVVQTRGLPRAERVVARADFVRAQKNPLAVARTKSLVLLVDVSAQTGATPNEQPARLGVVASKKVGDAVRRNRAKRLVRAAFRAAKEAFPPGFDFVVIASPAIADLGCAEVTADLTRALQSIKKSLARGGTQPQAPRALPEGPGKPSRSPRSR